MRTFLRIAVVATCFVATLGAAGAKAIVGGQLDGSLHPSVGFLLGLDVQGAHQRPRASAGTASWRRRLLRGSKR